MSVLTSLDHVIVAVNDIESASGTYTRLLGRPPSWRGAHPELGTSNALFRLENTYLELLASNGQAALPQGPVGLAFGTEDAELCAQELAERGLSPRPPVAGHGVDAKTGQERRWRNVFLSAEETRGVLVFAIEHDSRSPELPQMDAECDPAAAVHGLDHGVIFTAKPDATSDLYGEKLGIRLALDRTWEERGLRLLFFRIAGVTVEIAARISGEPSIGGRPSETEDFFWGLSWKVRDVQAARARLQASGFDMTEVRKGQKPGTSVCTVRDDPCGVATLIIGPDSE